MLGKCKKEVRKEMLREDARNNYRSLSKEKK